MDNSFISQQNIDNIYSYINADMVKNHNINLDIDARNKKIVKKLTKTVFNTLNNDLSNENSTKKVAINNFNDIVKSKCVPFLLKNYKNKHSPLKKKKYSVKNNKGVKNINTEPKFNLPNIVDNSNNNNNGSFQKYINDADQFEELVKVSNKKINDSFKAYSEKESIFNSHDNINESCNSINSDFNVERCAIKDDIKNGKLDKSAFDDAFSQTLLKKEEDAGNSQPSAYDNYNQVNVRELLSKVLINQKDHSNNEVETYDGELYLPNLIREVGEEAPIQPLLFQNTSQGSERLGIKNLILDSGDGSKLNLTAEGTPKPVTNLGNSTNFWYKLRINLQQTFKIDKLTDIFVKSFTLIGATENKNCLYFALNIEEFKIDKPSNNKYLKDKIIFRNTNILDSADTHVVSYTFPSRSYFVATTNPETFYNLTLELTNENGEHVDNNDNKTFRTKASNTNRFILELEFIPRTKPNDIIFDRTPYGSALNAELSNT